MAPKMQPPSEPTSLLWAYQIKREHGHISDRLAQLEAAIGRLEAQATADRDREAEVTALSQQLHAYTEESSKKNATAADEAIQQVRKDVSEQFEDVKGRLEAIITKLDAVDRDTADAAAKKKDEFNREVDMLKRVKRVEEEIDQYRNSLTALGKQLDEQCVQMVQEQIKKLLQEARNAGDDREKVKENLEMIEDALVALKEEKEKVLAEVQETTAALHKTASEATTASNLSMDNARDALLKAASISSATTVEGQPKKARGKPNSAVDADTKSDSPKVSHFTQAAGGSKKSSTNAWVQDRISRRSDSPVEPVRGVPPEVRTKEEDRALMKRLHDLKRLLPSVGPFEPGEKEAQAPKVTKRKRASKPKTASRKRVAAKATESQKQSLRDSATPKPAEDPEFEKRVTRRGRGWVEVVETADDNPLLPRGNELATIAEEEEPAEPARRSTRRRKIEQNDNTQARAVFGAVAAPTKSKKRKADADLIDETIDVDAPRATRRSVPPKKLTAEPTEEDRPVKRKRTIKQKDDFPF
ncbi:hypothetical protein CB0940_04069 [Cercospora beticola]|uniref:Uncharacterized protein n=1 Tax=Cercospora beticola TaxID=122368 RepID=A0A2G5HMR3_CERBT|nr:hypothetical protein CB0940_04069 [Cercospora beticola]PIA93830.1 hypothetical protein CB0940_04069 [Cercospora beticola]WPB01282.1 hypothetical protein RHO25_005906 [Cercospora beticola]